MRLTRGEICSGLGKREEKEGRGGLHRGWSQWEEGNLQLPVARGDGVVAGEAHSWCWGAKGKGAEGAMTTSHCKRGELKVEDGINIKIASF